MSDITNATEEETTKLVIEGRQMGYELLTTMVKSARSEREERDNLFKLQVAAHFIVASVVYNHEIATGSNPEEHLGKIQDLLKGEYEFVKEIQVNTQWIEKPGHVSEYH